MNPSVPWFPNYFSQGEQFSNYSHFFRRTDFDNTYNLKNKRFFFFFKDLFKSKLDFMVSWTPHCHIVHCLSKAIVKILFCKSTLRHAVHLTSSSQDQDYYVWAIMLTCKQNHSPCNIFLFLGNRLLTKLYLELKCDRIMHLLLTDYLK